MDNPQIYLIKATLNLDQDLIIDNQISFLSVHSLSRVWVDGIRIKEAKNLQGSLIFLDQSAFFGQNIMISNTSSETSSLIDV